MNPFGPLLGLPVTLRDGRRAADFAALLDGAVVPYAASSSGSALAPVAPLALAGRLRTLGDEASTAAVPSPAFRAALRGRLLAVAAVQGIGVQVADVPTVQTLSGARTRSSLGMAVAAGAMASVVAVTGAAVASQRSLPGDPFYAAKRATEGLQLRFADGPVGKGTQHLEFAQTRLREVRALALGRDELSASSALIPVGSMSALGGSVSDRVRETLAEMDDETRTGAGLLERSFRDSGEVEPLRVLATFARRQAGSLERVLPSLPVAARGRAQQSLSLVVGVVQSSQLAIDLGTCGLSCDPVGAGPTLPTASPEPAPGTSATPRPESTGPTGSSEPTDAPTCECPPTPEPQPAPEPSASESPSPSPQPTASPSPSPSPSAEPSPEPSPTSILPTAIPIPTVIPLPSGIPTSVPLPAVVLPPATPALPTAPRS